jgi:hypothetical protein
MHHTGVVDEGVEGAEALLDEIQKSPEGLRVSDVQAGAKRLAAEPLRDRPRAGIVQVTDRDPGAALREQLGGGAADPAGAAGDGDDRPLDRAPRGRDAGDERG